MSDKKSATIIVARKLFTVWFPCPRATSAVAATRPTAPASAYAFVSGVDVNGAPDTLSSATPSGSGTSINSRSAQSSPAAAAMGTATLLVTATTLRSQKYPETRDARSNGVYFRMQ